MGDILKADREGLKDISEIKIDMELPKDERIIDFIKQIGEPYLCKCGDMVVESVFEEDGITLSDRLRQYFKVSGEFCGAL